MKLLTTEEAAAKLGVTTARVRALILSGRLPATKFGRAHAIREEDLKLVSERKPGRPRKPGGSRKPMSRKASARKRLQRRSSEE